MAPQYFKSLSLGKQYAISIGTVLILAVMCYAADAFLAYRAVSLILLLAVSVLAVLLDIMPVLLAATLSALVWDYFFIPPKFTLQVANTEDALMLLMYFVVALVNAALTFNIRQTDIDRILKTEKARTLALYNTLLNSLSHELRTPIATIIGATDNLQSLDNKIKDADKTHLLAEIQVASLRLNQQVENLLNMSRLEGGVIAPKYDWCDVNELVHGVINRLDENAKKHNIEVLLSEDLPLFKLDYGLMEQVLHNIINNALHHTPAGTQIVITAIAQNNALVMCISDNGSGFPKDEIGLVFEKFYRLKNTKTGGTGLGLSIVKGVIEAHNGSIILENTQNGGAMFTINIPTEITFMNQLKNE